MGNEGATTFPRLERLQWWRYTLGFRWKSEDTKQNVRKVERFPVERRFVDASRANSDAHNILLGGDKVWRKSRHCFEKAIRHRWIY